MSDILLDYDQTTTLPVSTFTRTGYTFTGWATQANGGGNTYADEASYTMGAADETLYAQWSPWVASQSGAVSSVGSSTTYSNNPDNFSFKVMACPGGTFYTGTDDSGEATVSPFWLAETEATNELVASVYQWAYDEGKPSGGTVSGDTVDLYGQELLDLDSGQIQISYSGGTFLVDSGYKDYPCIDITWYASILMYNWLTEMVDGNDNNVVYS